jgi:hypothetical protein
MNFFALLDPFSYFERMRLSFDKVVNACHPAIYSSQILKRWGRLKLIFSSSTDLRASGSGGDSDSKAKSSLR